MNSEEINVGDFVEVVDCIEVYAYRKNMAKENGLKGYIEENTPVEGNKYKVVAQIDSDSLLGIEDPSGKQFIIGIDGVKKVKTDKAGLPEKFKFKTNLDFEYDAVLSECKTKYMVTWTNSSFHYPYPVTEVSKFVKRGFWTIIEEANGVDDSGRPLHFVKEMLKPFMRVKTKNGHMWIVVPNVQLPDDKYRCSGGYVLSNGGWTEFYTDALKQYGASTNLDIDEEYTAVEVYAAPSYNNDMINPSEVGDLVWKANSETPVEEIPNVENNFEQRLKHTEETLAGLEKERNMHVFVHTSNEGDTEEIKRKLEDMLKRRRLI